MIRLPVLKPSLKLHKIPWKLTSPIGKDRFPSTLNFGGGYSTGWGRSGADEIPKEGGFKGHFLHEICMSYILFTWKTSLVFCCSRNGWFFSHVCKNAPTVARFQELCIGNQAKSSHSMIPWHESMEFSPRGHCWNTKRSYDPSPISGNSQSMESLSIFGSNLLGHFWSVPRWAVPSSNPDESGEITPVSHL